MLSLRVRIVSKCYNINNKKYHVYGGKGIHIEIRECPPELVKALSIKRLDPFKAKYKVII